jgi:dsDNA-specific endonuclease/ATPase MutS2
LNQALNQLQHFLKTFSGQTMADTSTSSEYASMEQIKSQLTKEAYRENAPKVDQIRKEIAKSVFEARKELTGKQKDIFKRRDELASTIDKVRPPKNLAVLSFGLRNSETLAAVLADYARKVWTQRLQYISCSRILPSVSCTDS